MKTKNLFNSVFIILITVISLINLYYNRTICDKLSSDKDNKSEMEQYIISIHSRLDDIESYTFGYNCHTCPEELEDKLDKIYRSTFYYNCTKCPDDVVWDIVYQIKN